MLILAVRNCRVSQQNFHGYCQKYFVTVLTCKSIKIKFLTKFTTSSPPQIFKVSVIKNFKYRKKKYIQTSSIGNENLQKPKLIDKEIQIFSTKFDQTDHKSLKAISATSFIGLYLYQGETWNSKGFSRESLETWVYHPNLFTSTRVNDFINQETIRTQLHSFFFLNLAPNFLRFLHRIMILVSLDIPCLIPPIGKHVSYHLWWPPPITSRIFSGGSNGVTSFATLADESTLVDDDNQQDMPTSDLQIGEITHFLINIKMTVITQPEHSLVYYQSQFQAILHMLTPSVTRTTDGPGSHVTNSTGINPVSIGITLVPITQADTLLQTPLPPPNISPHEQANMSIDDPEL